MRDGWVETTLGELVSISTGKLDVNAEKEFGDYPFFTCAKEVYRIDIAAFDGEFVIIAGNGDLNVKYYNGKFNAYQRTYVIGSLDKNALCNKFLYFSMQKYIDFLRSESRGTTIQYLKKGQFTEAKLSLPPLAEQKRIVDLISSVDSYIEALQQQVDKARKSRNAVLHELLTKGGDGWVETTLGEVAQFFNGKAYSKEELLSQGKYRVLRVGNFFSNNSWYWSDLELESEKYCEAGDLLYAWSASFGPRIWKEEKVIYHYHIWKIVENPNLILKTWLFYWLDNDVEEMKSAAGTGSIMMHITKGEIEKRKIMLPSIEIQQVQIGVLQSFDATIQAQEATLKNMLNLRSALLSDLLSGNHEIPTTYDKLIGAA